MPARSEYDAVVVGAGPKGLAAAITLARDRHSVLLVEAADTVGGGTRSAPLTLPGFVHDTCSAIHPFALASPFFRALPLAEHGLEWVHPPLPLAHPFDDGSAAVLERSIEGTAATLEDDAQAYRRLLEPLVDHSESLLHDILGPLRWPRHPLALLRFARLGLAPARRLLEQRFVGWRPRGLLAGLAAHSVLPLERAPSAAAGLLLAVLGHRVGWPFPRGGAQRLAEALAAHLRSLGGEIVTGTRVQDLGSLPRARVVLLDLTPRQVLRLQGLRLPKRFRRTLARFRYGPGVCKLDLALAASIPWRNPDCSRAGTVHVGGTLEEIAASESAVWRGEHPERPFVLVAQQSLFDPTRAPAGMHTVWAYCHVPHGSSYDMSARMEAQIERFAPGFRERILARRVRTTVDLEGDNPNLVGGDIGGGVLDLGQLFTRPSRRRDPYSTPADNIYMCSASTPPGGGVHGMCGHFAARSAARRLG